MPGADEILWGRKRTRFRKGARKRGGRRACSALFFFCFGVSLCFLPGHGRATHAPIGASGRRSNMTLDRLALAVDGAESRSGTDPKMWRPDLSGPQGPMQVTAAAATDVGGGNRFDPRENLALGKAYLGLLYRRFGSWSDAVAAYNWGPGHLEAWVKGGRVAARLPREVALYRARVLRGALFPKSAWAAKGSGGFRRRRLGIVHRQPRRRGRTVLSAADRRALRVLYGVLIKGRAKR